MNRTATVALIAAVSAIAAVGIGVAVYPTRPPGPPDVVVLLIDDAGWADFSMHGSPDFHTPRIDALASEGVRFTAGYVAAPICSPSRAALLTGRYPQRFGHEGNPPVDGGPSSGLPLSEHLIPELLAPAGYTSAVIGKWHLGDHPRFHPNRRGFDHFSGILRGERPYFPGRTKRGEQWEVNGTPVAEEFTYVTDHIADEALAFLASEAGPRFLFVSFTGVHAPLQALKADVEAADPGLPVKRRKLAAMTASVDRAVGRVLDAVPDDALVFLINDNGAGAKNHGDNQPWRGGKSRVYEGGIRVPFVVRLPGVPPQVYDSPVSTLDVLPTVLSMLHLPVPPELDGVDLVPFLDGRRTDAPHEALFWRLGTSWAVRRGDLKLVWDRDDGPGLYDLATDPSETTDLGDIPERRSLQEAYDTWNAQNIEPAFESATERRTKRETQSE